MNKNAFDMGYEVVYATGTKGQAFLQKKGGLPLIELYRSKDLDPIWFFRELVPTDDVIDTVLPRDWKIRKYSGFSTIKEFSGWIAH